MAPSGTVHHTDRGGHYTSRELRKAMGASEPLGSLGRIGQAVNNARAVRHAEVLSPDQYESLHLTRREAPAG